MQVTPHLGYSLSFIRATSHVLGRFAEGDIDPAQFILPDQNIGASRFLLGATLAFSAFEMAVEAALGDTQTVTLRGGVSF